MNWTPAEAVAAAVLYEGYLLYPYRASALKNGRRATFGELAPGESTGIDCLVAADLDAPLAVRVRCLRAEAERDVALSGPLRRGGGDLDGGLAEWSAAPEPGGLVRLSLRIWNRGTEPLLSAHALLAVEGGAFRSSADPGSERLEHRGLWGILAGTAPDRSLLLAAPILLPDYPSVAPESPRDLFDATEIDEILSLRIRTLSDEEKAEIRAGDERGRRLLERAESLGEAELLALHGAARPALRPGDRVRLRPCGRADAFDVALAGRDAVVVAVEEDLEGRRHVAVTLDDDPGADLGRAGFPGHRFYFRPDEVELR